MAPCRPPSARDRNASASAGAETAETASAGAETEETASDGTATDRVPSESTFADPAFAGTAFAGTAFAGTASDKETDGADASVGEVPVSLLEASVAAAS